MTHLRVCALILCICLSFMGVGGPWPGLPLFGGAGPVLWFAGVFGVVWVCGVQGWGWGGERRAIVEAWV
jgi:hypothetical protein